MREKILAASMECPIHLKGDDYFCQNLDELLSILRQGRFVIRYYGSKDGPNTEEIITKINKVRRNA